MTSRLEGQIPEESSTSRLQPKLQSNNVSKGRNIDLKINQLMNDVANLEAYLVQLKQQDQKSVSLNLEAEQEIQKPEEKSLHINILGY